MPGASSREITALHRQLNTAATSAQVAFKAAQGCWIESADGERYLDLIAGYGVASTGWQHPRLVECIRAQSAGAIFAPPMLPTLESAQFSHALLEVMAVPEEWRCIRATGGADANEQMLKAVAVLADRRGRPWPHRILRFARAYHGGTCATLAVSDVEANRLPRPLAQLEHPMLPLPAGPADIGAAADLLEQDASISAVLVEPVIGSGGVYPFPWEYLRALRGLCTEHGVPLIFDEVLTGCGRVGALLAAHLAGVDPDAVTLGKGLSAGAAAVGAALVSPALAEAASGAEDTTSTFAWSPLACAVAAENLRIIEEESLHSRAALVGPRLHSGVAEIFERAFGERARVRGIGMMIGAEVRDAARAEGDASLLKRLMLRCKQAGLLVGASWDWKTLVLLPPLILSEAEADQALDRLDTAVANWVRSPAFR